MRTWSSSHVVEESQVIMEPHLADLDAASSVTGVRFDGLEIATTNHTLPDTILGCFERLAVFVLPFGSFVALKATATARVTNPQAVAIAIYCLATLTLALPAKLPRWSAFGQLRQNRKPTKAPSDQVNQCAHSLMVSQKGYIV